MELQHKQQVQQSQHLIMSANMQQALHVLQLPIQELDTFVTEQVMLNPALELDWEENMPYDGQIDEQEYENKEDDSDLQIEQRDMEVLQQLNEDEHNSSDNYESQYCTQDAHRQNYLEHAIAQRPSLYTRLMEQARDSFETPSQLTTAEIIIGYIDELGFLQNSLDEICYLHSLEKAQAEGVVKEIQTFEPYGVGASTICESLLIQLRCLHKSKTLAYKIVSQYYEQLVHNQIPIIQKKLGCSYNQIKEAIANDISKLNIHPGAQILSNSAAYIVPDGKLWLDENGNLMVDVDKDYVPTLRINPRYFKLLNDEQTPTSTKQFIQQHILSARWLARNLQHRYSSLARVCQLLAEKQKSFFCDVHGELSPLTMQAVADELNLHESTVARIVAHKYIDSPRGILPLKSLFTTKYVADDGQWLSSATIKQTILAVIQQEDKGHPLSDQEISALLTKQGITCARRTVTKYRQVLHLGNVQQRKQFINARKKDHEISVVP